MPNQSEINTHRSLSFSLYLSHVDRTWRRNKRIEETNNHTTNAGRLRCRRAIVYRLRVFSCIYYIKKKNTTKRVRLFRSFEPLFLLSASNLLCMNFFVLFILVECLPWLSGLDTRICCIMLFVACNFMKKTKKKWTHTMNVQQMNVDNTTNCLCLACFCNFAMPVQKYFYLEIKCVCCCIYTWGVSGNLTRWPPSTIWHSTTPFGCIASVERGYYSVVLAGCHATFSELIYY